jgi:hypothetical protein
MRLVIIHSRAEEYYQEFAFAVQQINEWCCFWELLTSDPCLAAWKSHNGP